MQWLTFDGIAPKHKPQHVESRHARTAHNLDLYSGELRPFNSPGQMTPLVDDCGNIMTQPARTFYRAGETLVGWPNHTWVASDTQGQPGFDSFLFVKDNALYWQSAQRMARNVCPVKVGVCRPETPPTAVVMPGTGCYETSPELTCVTGTNLDPNCNDGDAPEPRAYVATFIRVYPDCYGRMEESAPSAPVFAEILHGDGVNLSIAIPPGQGITGVRWYRSIAGTKGFSTFLYVGESANGNFHDDVCTAALGEPLRTEHDYPPPSCIDGVATVGDAMTVVWHGKSFWVSEPMLPHAYNWDQNQFDLPYQIRAMVERVRRLEGSKTFDMHVLTDGKPFLVSTGGRSNTQRGDSGMEVDIQEYQGWHPLVSIDSVTEMPDGATGYASSFGYMAFSGTAIRNLTDNWMTDLEWKQLHTQDVRAQYWNGRIWLGWPNRIGYVLNIEPEGSQRPPTLVTHSVHVNAWYARAGVDLMLSDPLRGMVFAWGTGTPLRWVWESTTIIQKGLWKPSTIKVVSDAWRHREDLVEMEAEYAAFMHNRDCLDVFEFFAEHPQWSHLLQHKLESTPIKIDVLLDGCPLYSTRVTTSRQIRIPRTIRGFEWSVRLTGYSHVREVHAQTSVADLVQGVGHG